MRSLLLILTVTLGTVVACMTSNPAAAPTAMPARTVTIGAGVDVESVDPMITTSATSRSVMGAIFDTLVVRDSTMAVKPSLATSWDTPGDATWVFHLRDGVRFQNGDAFDASAVKFTLQRFVDPATKAPQASLLKQVKSVDIMDSRTVRVTTDGPYAALLDVLANFVFIMDPAVNGHDATRMVIGTGPYRFVEWQPGQRLVLNANPNYWGEKPQLDQIVLRPIPEAATRLVELKSGGVDVILPVAPTQYGDVTSSGATLDKTPGFIITIMFNEAMKPFDDQRVRQAFNYAIDRQAIINGVLRGAGYEMASVLGPGELGYDPTLQPYPHDPARAKALLAEAGQTDVSVVLGSPDGRYPDDRLVAQAVTAELGEVGVRATVVTSEYSAYVQSIIGRKLQFFLIGQADVDAEINLPQALLPSGPLYQNYNNQQVMQLVQQASATLDASRRAALYKQVAQLVHDDPPWLFLYTEEDAYGVAGRVTGFTARPDGLITLNDLGVVSTRP